MIDAPPPPPPPRRIVTGHTDDGRSVVDSAGPAPVSRTLPDGTVFHEVWNTEGAPAPIAPREPIEPTERHLVVPPPPHGSIIRIIDLPPGSRSPMHRTESVDYGIVLSGVVTLVVDDGAESSLTPGDVVVQRGTDHAWHNRSDDWARMAFILIDGAFAPGLRATLGQGALDGMMGDPAAS